MKIAEKIKNKFILGMLCGVLAGCVGMSGVFMYMNKNRKMPDNFPTMNGERPGFPMGENGEMPEPPSGMDGKFRGNKKNNNSVSSTTNNDVETQTQ